MKKLTILLLLLLFASTVLGEEKVEREYCANGQLKGEWTYQDGKQHGLGKRYDENGRLMSTEPVKTKHQPADASSGIGCVFAPPRRQASRPEIHGAPLLTIVLKRAFCDMPMPNDPA